MAINIENKLNTSCTADYSHIIPWYMRLYYHTMEASLNGKRLTTPGEFNSVITDLNIEPATDRAWPGTFSATFRLPAASSLSIVIHFETNFLHWAEFPPDAHRGSSMHFTLVASSL